MIDFSASRLQPQAVAVYAALGLKSGCQPSPRSAALLQRALELFCTCSDPRSVTEPISQDEFAAVYSGQGRNAPDTPLSGIFPHADCLHLFAFTLGTRISGEIKRLFASNDFAQGSVLDAVASVAADNAGRIAEQWAKDQAPGQKNGVLARTFLYSPGYCGWHISGQEKLFARLRPDKIGISLNSNFLMDPLKSISGVLVTGPAASHQFSKVYPFCSICTSPTCREKK